MDKRLAIELCPPHVTDEDVSMEEEVDVDPCPDLRDVWVNQTIEKRRASPDSLADEMASPKRIELCLPLESDQDEEVVNVDPLKFYNNVLLYLIGDDDLWRIAEVIKRGAGIPRTLEHFLARTLEDFLLTLDLPESTITNDQALRHFDKVKSIWENRHFLDLLHVKMTGYLPELNTYALLSRLKLSCYLVPKIRSDPSFKEEEIFNSQDQTTRMRNALSILIGYWGNRDMISEMMTDIICSSLRSRLNVVKVDDAFLPWGEFSTPIEDCSPIEGLCNDPYIKVLANLLSEIPQAVRLTDRYLAALNGGDGTTSYDYHLGHCLAASNFWVDSYVLKALAKALWESPSLVSIFKKYSKRAQGLRCLDRLTRIQKDSLLQSVLKSDDLAYKMSGALSILYGYWSDYDVRELYHNLHAFGRYNFIESGKCDIKDGYFKCLGDFKNVLGKRLSKDSKQHKDLLEKVGVKQGRGSSYSMASPIRIELRPYDEDVNMEEDFVDLLESYSGVLCDLIDDEYFVRIADEVIKGGVVPMVGFLRTLAPCPKSERTNQALQHFDEVKAIWGNKRFLKLLLKMRVYLPDFSIFGGVSRVRLSCYLLDMFKKDPSFKEEEIFKSQDQPTKMRNALSILIGYWSNEVMISVMLSIGGSSLRSLLNVVKVDDALLSTHVEDCSPIEELRNDPSIMELAKQLLKVPEAVRSADNYLAALKGDEGTTRYDYHELHWLAAYSFWVNSDILRQLIKALNESTSLLNNFVKYSKRAQCFRCLERLTCIQNDSLLEGVLEESADGAHKMRGVLSVLIGYWTDDYDMHRFWTSKLHKSRCDSNKAGGIKAVEYFRECLGDFKGLENVLVEHYPKDSEQYEILFDKIKQAQLDKEKIPNRIPRWHKDKPLDLPERHAALIKVGIRNSNVRWMEVFGL